MLTPPSNGWAGVDGRVLIMDHFAELPAPDLSTFKPQFVVLHNTDNPMLDEALAKANGRGWWTSVSDQQRLLNMQTYYHDTEKWRSGPHLFVTDQAICLFTPLSERGTHSPSWNSVSWGIEIVGNYDLEPLTLETRANVIVALGMLCKWGGFAPETTKLHKEDPLTTHKTCPGKNIDLSDILDGTKQFLETQ